MYCICCKEDKATPFVFEPDSNTKTEEDMWWLRESMVPKSNCTVKVGTKLDSSISPGKEFFRVNANHCIDNLMVNGGIIQTIDARYGSSHDTDKFIISICDECIDKELENGNLLYWGNYYNPTGKTTYDDIEKSKKIYRRRKNLDNLT